jgi:uncharacterized protein (DUF58 family)
VSTPDPPLEWRLLSFGLFVAAAGIFIAAILARNPVPIFFALPLLLAPVAAALGRPETAPRAQITWADEGSAGEVKIRGRIVPEDGLRPVELVPRFYRPPILEEVAPPKLVYREDSILFELSWSAARPCLVVVPLPRVKWRDPVGLVEESVALTGLPLSLDRFPPELLRLGRVPLRRTILVPGEIRARAIGRNGDFFAVRESVPSDTSRQINWRATARLGRRVANDYFLERTGDVLIFLDLRPTELGARMDAQLLALSTAAAYGMADAFLDEKARVGLAFFDEFLTAYPLASGRTQRYRVREALRKVRMGTSAGPSERAAIALRRYFPPNLTTIFFSPLADATAGEMIPHLRLRGFPVLVVSPSPLPLYTDDRRRQGPVDPLALRLLRLARRDRIGETWRDAPVVDWDEYWSLGRFVDLVRTPTRHLGAR